MHAQPLQIRCPPRKCLSLSSSTNGFSCLTLVAILALAACDTAPKGGGPSESNLSTIEKTIVVKPKAGLAYRKDDNTVDFDLSSRRSRHKVSLRLPRTQSVDVLVSDESRPEWIDVLVSDLMPGDQVRMATGELGLVEKNDRAPDLSVESGKSIVVGKSERLTDTLLEVRTAGDVIQTTPAHPFMVQGKGWTEAKNLEKGDRLEGKARHVEVVSTLLRKVPPQWVFNLETWPDHTFRVGKEDVLVHNGNCVTPPGAAENINSLANRLNHIFGKAQHNLGPLLQQFSGSQEAAFDALKTATEVAVNAKSLTGVFETVVQVGGLQVTVRGAVVSGAIKIGTAFIP